jgi:hypothetical protein
VEALFSSWVEWRKRCLLTRIAYSRAYG